MAATVFPGAGEMAVRCRAFDWAATPLGPIETWPPSLRTTAGLVLGSALPMLLLWGPELIQIYNDGYRALMGAKHPGGLGQASHDCWPEVRHINAPVYERVRAGETVAFEDARYAIMRHGALEDAYFTMGYSAVRDERGAVAGVLLTVVETTAQVRSRGEREAALVGATARLHAQATELEGQDARLQFAMEVAELGAWDLNLATGDAWRSLRHDQIFGYDALLPEWTYEHFLAHVVPEDRPAVDASFGAALAARTPWDFTCRITRADGAERWIAARGEPVVGERDGSVQILGIIRDITAQVDAEGALRAAKDSAEAANRAKSEFLAVMSHELRTPLNAIGGYAELMELGVHGPVTADQRAALERIQRSQRHLLGLINGVLNYARVEAGAVHYALTEVALDDVLATCEALTAPQVRTKGLTLAHAGCGPGLRVRADGEKLQQIVLNLLSNAVKFTEPGGRIELRCVADGGRVGVQVADTGIGIAPDKLAHVFEPFVQVDARLTRTREGTGLGLAISRDLAQGMDGDLTVESRLSEGSTFTLTLPRAV